MTREWLRQFVGVLALGFLTWAFLNTPDQQAWNLALSALLALAGLALATWLIAANFTESSSVEPRRYLGVAASFAGLLALLLLLSLAKDAWGWRANAWIGSAISLQRKKPFSPERAYQWVGWFFFAIRWIVLPLFFIPLVRRPVRYPRFVLSYLAALVAGAVVPHYLVHWVPPLTGFWPQAVSAGFRFLLAYAILITAWVLLGRSTREAAPS